MPRNYLKEMYDINFEISIKNIEKEILQLYQKNDMMNVTPHMHKDEKKAREQIFFKEIEVLEAKIHLNRTLQKLDMFGVTNLLQALG
jgi:ribosome biogenesis GTPase A